MCPSNLWSWFRFAFLAILTMTLLLASGSAKAQLSAGSVTGIVRDPTGSVVAKASVTLRNVDTMVQHTTVSNDAGNYVFLSLGPGRYALEASASGFATKRVAEFVLAVNQTASIDISLQVGSQSDVVTISAETEQLDVSSADLGTVIATKQVNYLPLNGRKFNDLAILTPGVQVSNPNLNSSSTNGFFKTSVAILVCSSTWSRARMAAFSKSSPSAGSFNQPQFFSHMCTVT